MENFEGKKKVPAGFLIRIGISSKFHGGVVNLMTKIKKHKKKTDGIFDWVDELDISNYRKRSEEISIPFFVISKKKNETPPPLFPVQEMRQKE